MSRHLVTLGFCRRLAADPDADAYALRGGTLVAQWFPEMGRQPRDIDLVCGLPYDVPAMRRHLGRLLERDVGDGVRFGDGFRTDPIWPNHAHPGLRLVAIGQARGVWAELHVDFTFRLPLWPAALPALLPDAGVVLRQCRPETLIARKLAVTAELGPMRWRPKDLVDLWWLTRSVPALSQAGEAVERTFSLAELADGPARRTFWQDGIAAGRFARFVSRHPRLQIPWDLARVVDDVRERLSPLTRLESR